jgi:hypothetical protein
LENNINKEKGKVNIEMEDFASSTNNNKNNNSNKENEINPNLKKKFFINLKRVDFSQNQISEQQWKPLIASIFAHQGKNINQLILQECELDDTKV